ncbi:maleylpyruvate isomerase N-terminal domain-containing protein [Virgisporangium ochraceum]|uniref:Mycothiol-dependent maleylpyruvate isomerase metal-binding domain-containing protein n=1 Tax=Virgisporangium ochraceum TaxID=65505 RepID=A0A8J4EA49_9ACTN|nr:maleylpyruvate isomerase family mycothiol-dependent enzyme [Virgisporangium ochraceum]GIJ67033.1 hypothetical protein Voc01_019500 [Virgisporangium ochraceum]
MTLDDRLSTLDELWAVWAAHGTSMTDEQWSRPTRLGDWDVLSLFAHHGAWPFMLGGLLTRVQEREPTHATAAALLRDFNAPDGVANTRRRDAAESAPADAERYGRAAIVEQFTTAGPRALEAARALGPVVVDYFGHAALRLEEAISIGIMEATVHLLDLRRALGQEPDVPAAGLAHTAALLAQMAPPVDLIEAATGRSRVDVFPVLT